MDVFRKWPRGEPKELICEVPVDGMSGDDLLRRNIYLFSRDFLKKREFGGPWITPQMQFRRGEPVDMPHVGFGHVAVSSKLAGLMRPLIENQAELLPIAISNCSKQYFWIFSKPIPDALDFERSVIKYSSDNPERIRTVDKYVFNKSVLEGINIFGPHATDTRPFFSRKLVSAIEAGNPLGIEFRPV